MLASFFQRLALAIAERVAPILVDRVVAGVRDALSPGLGQATGQAAGAAANAASDATEAAAHSR